MRILKQWLSLQSGEAPLTPTSGMLRPHADAGGAPLKLHVFRSAWGGTQPSNYCLKVDVWMQMAGIPFERVESNLASRAPRGRVPYVIFPDGTWIDDSEAIIAELGRRYGFDADAVLGDRDRAVSRAMQRMVDEHMFFHLIDSRWTNDACWPHVRDNFLGPWPLPLRYVVGLIYRRGVRNRLKKQGIGRYRSDERLEKATADLIAINGLLGDKPFLFGAEPRSVDAAVYGILACIIMPNFQTVLSQRMREFPRLVDYVERMSARFGRGVT